MLLTLDDQTEFVHTETGPDGRVRVDVELPDAELCFKMATCWLPDYTWEDVPGFTPKEIRRLQEVVKSCAHKIIGFPRAGDSAARFAGTAVC